MGGHSQTGLATGETKENSDYRAFDDSLKRLVATDAGGDTWTYVYEMSSDNTKLPPITEARIFYPSDLPKWDKPVLPGDILLPHPVALQAKEWKGVKIPFQDSRFEPLLLCDRDTDFMTCNLDPFRYFHRKRKFPEKHRCPYLPIPTEAYRKPDQLGNFSSVKHTSLPDRRIPKKRFPRPPESFITRLW